MSVLTVGKDELFEMLQSTSLIKIRFESSDVWDVFPILYASKDNLEILKGEQNICTSGDIGNKILFKFQKQGFEYIVNGKLIDKSGCAPYTLTIMYAEAKKYINIRRFIRFETNLESSIRYDELYTDIIKCKDRSSIQWSECTVRNISKGGALLVSDKEIDYNIILEIKIKFDSGSEFFADVEILRKSYLLGNKFSYGVKFLRMKEDSKRILFNEILKLERAYFNYLNPLKEYTKSSDLRFDTKVIIMSNNPYESHDLSEPLIKIGVENYEVINSFKFYYDFLEEEKPKLIIIDAQTISDEVISLIDNIKADLPGIKILLTLPIQFFDESNTRVEVKEVDILYKPLIYNEFEDKIIKYL